MSCDVPRELIKSCIEKCTECIDIYEDFETCMVAKKDCQEIAKTCFSRSIECSEVCRDLAKELNRTIKDHVTDPCLLDGKKLMDELSDACGVCVFLCDSCTVACGKLNEDCQIACKKAAEACYACIAAAKKCLEKL